MYTPADLPETLPIFPLSGALLLPRGHLPLHIFEPRFLTMLDDALRSGSRLIGMIQPENEDEGAPLNKIGCAGRITSFRETQDRTYMITLTGVSRFILGKNEDGFQPYLRASVDWAEFARDLKGPERDPGLNRDTFLPLLARYFQAVEIESDWDSLKEAETEMLINVLAALSPFDAKDKQALLEARTLSRRREILVALMELAARGGTGKERLQ
ncbi:MAG: ATP-dependent protease [Rhodobacteraceae bacterium]|nr:ATP-dependent protease [Paracoccaceae bacterium]